MNFKNVIEGENTLNYYLALFFGVIKKILEILIFIVPIQCINSVNNGRLSNRLTILFKLLGFSNINDENQIQFFSLIFIILMVFLYLNVLIKRQFINSIKQDKLDIKIRNKIYNDKEFELNEIDKNIENNSLLIFCMILLVSLIFYDYIIGIIILVSGYLSILISRKVSDNYLSNLQKNKVDKRFNKVIYKKGFLLRNLQLNKLNNNFIDNKLLINSSVNVATMLCIMYSIYFREDSNISIIYIFIIRIYLNRTKNVISGYFKKNRLIKKNY